MKYYIKYRDEFYVVVNAKNEEEALEKAKRSDSWSLIYDLWEDLITIENMMEDKNE